MFAATSFVQRYEWIKSILNRFHTKINGLSTFLHKSELHAKTKLRGYEIYTHDQGVHGCFVELETDSVTVLKSDIPDVYTIKDHEGYVRIPDLKTSQYMRSKTFPCSLKCKKEDDESWSITENIP